MKTSRKLLETLVNQWINPRLGFPDGTPLWQTVDGQNRSTKGMMYLSRGFSHWELLAMANETGGVHVVLSAGTAGQMEDSLRAFIKGLDYLRSEV